MTTDKGKMQAAIDIGKKSRCWLCLSIRGGKIQILKVEKEKVEESLPTEDELMEKN